MLVRNIIPVCTWTSVRATSALSSCAPTQSLMAGSFGWALVAMLSPAGRAAADVSAGFLQPKSKRTIANKQPARPSHFIEERLGRTPRHFNLLFTRIGGARLGRALISIHGRSALDRVSPRPVEGRQLTSIVLSRVTEL